MILNYVGYQVPFFIGCGFALIAALVTLRLDPVKQRSAARVALDDATRGTAGVKTDALSFREENMSSRPQPLFEAGTSWIGGSVANDASSVGSSARRVGFVSDSAKQGPAAPGVPRQMMACSMAMTAAAVRFGASSLARMLPT